MGRNIVESGTVRWHSRATGALTAYTGLPKVEHVSERHFKETTYSQSLHQELLAQ